MILARESKVLGVGSVVKYSHEVRLCELSALHNQNSETHACSRADSILNRDSPVISGCYGFRRFPMAPHLTLDERRVLGSRPIDFGRFA